MAKSFLEPGLLPVFRLFAALQFGLLALVAFAFALRAEHEAHPAGAVAMMAAVSSVLLAVLSWRRLWRSARRLLPGALTLAWTVPLAGQGLLLGAPFSDYAALAAEASVFLLLPLLVISWQYGFRWVTLFSLGAALLDLSLIKFIFDATGGQSADLSRLVVLRTAGFLAIGYVVSSLMRGQREQRLELADANERLRRQVDIQKSLAASRERNRLARELHDILSHTLSGAAVQLEAVKTLWSHRPGKARKMLESALQAVRNGMQETRRAVTALRASPLEDLGLIPALRELAESVAARAGWILELRLDDELGALSPELEQGLYRVVQEALANAERHAMAQQVAVRLSRQEGGLVLSVADDGRGFEVGAVNESRHFGLSGMRERAEAMNGVLGVKCPIGGGTLIELTIPA